MPFFFFTSVVLHGPSENPVAEAVMKTCKGVQSGGSNYNIDILNE